MNTNRCSNCGVLDNELETGELCSPCRHLRDNCGFRPRMWGENQGLFNRRWQMHFNRGDLTESWPTTPLWERKMKQAKSYVFYIDTYRKRTKKVTFPGNRFAGMHEAWTYVQENLKPMQEISMFWPVY